MRPIHPSKQLAVGVILCAVVTTLSYTFIKKTAPFGPPSKSILVGFSLPNPDPTGVACTDDCDCAYISGCIDSTGYDYRLYGFCEEGQCGTFSPVFATI